MARRDPHYRDGYDKQATANLKRWNADTTTRCWQCNQTQAQHQRPWTNGHVIDGQPHGELRPECAACNYRRGATHGNQLRTTITPTRTR